VRTAEGVVAAGCSAAGQAQIASLVNVDRGGPTASQGAAGAPAPAVVGVRDCGGSSRPPYPTKGPNERFP
jgi:hypothetical protein